MCMYYKKDITSVITHLIIISTQMMYCNMQQIPWILHIFSKAFSRFNYSVLMFFTINSIHCFIYFLFLPPYYSTTFHSCNIFSFLHYFFFTLLTLQYFLLFLSFSNMNFNIEETLQACFLKKHLQAGQYVTNL